MARRNLLHKQDLDLFCTYLNQAGYQYRPGKGTYEVIQVQCNSPDVGDYYVPIYDRNGGDHFTIQDSMVYLVRGFLRWKRKNEEQLLADPISELQMSIATWANEIIPDRTAHNAIVKLMVHELPELLNGGLDDPLEYADIAILVFDIAYLQGINIGKAIRDKMEINRDRKWETDPNTGILSHVND